MSLVAALMLQLLLLMICRSGQDWIVPKYLDDDELKEARIYDEDPVEYEVWSPGASSIHSFPNPMYPSKMGLYRKNAQKKRWVKVDEFVEKTMTKYVNGSYGNLVLERRYYEIPLSAYEPKSDSLFVMYGMGLLTHVKYRSNTIKIE